MGAEVIIAVYLGMGVARERPRNMVEILWRSFSIMQNNSLRDIYDRCDVVIEPDVSSFMWDEFHRGRELVAAGEVAARAALPKIRSLMVPREFPATEAKKDIKLGLAGGSSPLP
jgi:NTE family protein